MARAMVAQFGMVESFGPAVFATEPRGFLGGSGSAMPDSGHHAASEATARAIDELVRGIVRQALERSLGLLRERRALLERTARTLLERESLSAEELAAMAGQVAAPA
jgi:cell division protease FtsH